MRRLITLAILLSLGCATTTVRRETSLLVGATAFDMATTRVAVSRGASEANPVMRNEVVALAVNAALTLAIVHYSKILRARGVRNWYMPLRIWSALHIGAGGWNAVQMR